MKTSQLTLLFFLCALCFFSCDPVVTTPEADLRVQVKGYFSGNNREGLTVQLFSTREDAQDLIDPLTPILWTDRFGEVEFYGLFVKKKYFVRVDAAATKTIRSSGRLDYGINNCIVKIL